MGNALLERPRIMIQYKEVVLSQQELSLYIGRTNDRNIEWKDYYTIVFS